MTRGMVPDAERFKDVKIEYRDEDGRLLTTKEEFRRLNYKFHGYVPSLPSLPSSFLLDGSSH